MAHLKINKANGLLLSAVADTIRILQLLDVIFDVLATTVGLKCWHVQLVSICPFLVRFRRKVNIKIRAPKNSEHELGNDVGNQCDRMARLFPQYLAIYNNANLPNSKKLPL